MATQTWSKGDTGTGRVAQAFKIKYGKFLENYIYRANPARGRIRTVNDLVGEKTQFLVDVGYIGGAGASDTIPTSNRGFYYRPELSEETLQVSAEIEHKGREFSKGDVAAFVEGQKHVVKKIAEKFDWLDSFALWGPGDGSMGVIDSGGVTDNGSGEYDLVITAATYQRRRFQKREIVNIESGNTDKFEITAVNPSTRTVSVKRISGSQVPADSDEIFLQNSEDNFPVSLRQAFEFTTGSLYGVAFDELDWSPTRVNASSANVSVDMLNELALKMHEKCGKTPTALYMNHNVMRSVMNSIEDRKNYFTNGEVKNRKGDFGFSAVNFMSINGAIPMLIEPNLYDTEIVGLVEDMIVQHRSPTSPDFVKSEGGDILHLKPGSNAYELRYCSYQQLEACPLFVGQIYGLTV